MSKPERGPSSYHLRDIIDLLKARKTLKEIALADAGFPLPSRLAMLMTECGSDVFWMKRETIRVKLDCRDNAAIDKAFRTVERRWELFKPVDGTPKHGRVKLRGETEDDFKKRVLKKIDTELAILWVLSDITNSGTPEGKVGSHSNAEFVKDTGRSLPKVISALNRLDQNHKGYIFRWRFGSNRSRYQYARPTNDHIIFNVFEKSPQAVPDW